MASLRVPSPPPFFIFLIKKDRHQTGLLEIAVRVGFFDDRLGNCFKRFSI